MLKVAVAVGALGLVALAFASRFFGIGHLGPLLPAISLGVGLTLTFRIALWWRYRPIPRAATPTLPSLTVVVPAYNEGAGVSRTLESLLASDYPRDRLRVIAVNDGSKDDTGEALDSTLRRLRAAGEDRLEVIHLPENRGKRHALHAGLTRATSDLVATVDSDSVVAPETLAHLVAPMRDPTVGGVAGKVLVLNRGQNLLTRMLHVRYVLGFDFIRAYQSMLRTVWCCPGALQCYRRELIAPHLDRWLAQTFLGARCTNGDDHALTNIVLSLDHDTRYQSTALVYTVVPHRYTKLAKMFLRWARSATREGLRALRFVPRRGLGLTKRRGLLGAWLGLGMAFDALMQPLTIALRVASVLGGSWLLFASPVWLLRSLCASTLLALPWATIYLRSERDSDVLFGILYGWYAIFALFWIQPLAVLTVRKNGWMTRG
jgi:hyaluronan synthase